MLKKHNILITKTIDLKKMITLICLIVFFLPLISIVFYSYHSLKTNLYDKLNQDIENMVAKSAENLENDFDLISTTYFNLISDPIINSELYATISGDLFYTNISKPQIEERLTKFLLYNVAFNSNLINSVNIFYEDDYICIQNGKSSERVYNVIKSEMVDVRDQLKQQILNQKRIHQYTQSNTDPLSLYYIRDFYKPTSYYFSGVVILQINQEALSSSYQYFKSYDSAFGFVQDKSGNIVTSNIESLNGKQLINASVKNTPLREMLHDSSNYKIYQKSLQQGEYVSTIIIPLAPIHHKLVQNMKSFLIIMLVCLILILFICFLLPHMISNYLNLIVQKMTCIRQGDYNTSLPSNPITELNDLNQSFNYMSQEIKRLITEVYSTELLLKEAEINALQAQINPHFLFNTLLCISWKAKACGNEEVYHMISTLSTLMRTNIFIDSNQKILIEKELETSKLYLELQKYRFGEQLHYSIDVEDSILSCLIPKLTIQPLVENAVIHGLENKLGTGFIKITGKILNSRLQIVIFDNGLGFQKDPLINLPPSNSANSQTHSHVGMYNCNKRIRQIYGEKYGITIDSILNEYTRVIITIPIDKGDLTDV